MALSSDSVGGIVFVLVFAAVAAAVVVWQHVRVRVLREIISELYTCAAMGVDLVSGICGIRLASFFCCGCGGINHSSPLFVCVLCSPWVHIILRDDNSAVCLPNQCRIRKYVGPRSPNDRRNDLGECFEVVAGLCQKRGRLYNPLVVV